MDRERGRKEQLQADMRSEADMKGRSEEKDTKRKEKLA